MRRKLTQALGMSLALLLGCRVVTAQQVWTFDCDLEGFEANDQGAWLSWENSGDGGKAVHTYVEDRGFDPWIQSSNDFNIDVNVTPYFIISMNATSAPGGELTGAVFFFDIDGADEGLVHLAQEAFRLPISWSNGQQIIEADARDAERVWSNAEPATESTTQFTITMFRWDFPNDEEFGDYEYSDFQNTRIEIDWMAVSDDPNFRPAVQDTLGCGPGTEGEGEGEIAVDPQFALFPDQAVEAGPTSPYIINVGNAGTGNLNITDVNRTGVDAPHFVVSSDTGQTTLAPAEERTIGVAFDPSSTGDKIAYLSVESDDATDPVVHVYLWGHAYAGGEIQVTPTAYTWPYQSIPDAPAVPGTVTITNTGGGGLSLSGVSLTGTNPGQFLITDDTGQTSLSASQSRMVDVAFNPSMPGAKAASLRITSDDSDEPTVDVSLSGIGFDPVAGYTSPVWVDANYTGTEMGSETQPYNTLAEGRDLVLSGGVIKVKPGASNETLRIEKPMRIEAVSAPVTIGAPGNAEEE